MTKIIAIHLLKVRPAPFGAGLLRSSACGRLNAASVDGMNVTDIPAEVTCKFCLARMAANERRNGYPTKPTA